jgi:hypothetical protein
MIITCKKKVPFHWIAFAILPWAAFTFKGGRRRRWVSFFA